MPGPDEPIIISDGSPLDISCKDTDNLEPLRQQLVLKGRNKALAAYQGPTDAKPVAASGALAVTVGYSVTDGDTAVAHTLTATTNASGADLTIDLDESLDNFHAEQHNPEKQTNYYQHKHEVKITAITLVVGGIAKPVDLKPVGPNPFAIWLSGE
jgi:hypothetical protein